MARKPKKVATEADLSKPLLKELQDDKSCYGKEYDATDKLCAKCADNLTCAVYFMRELTTKIKAVDKTEKFLDLQNFELVPTEKLQQIIIQTGEQKVKHLLGAIQKFANTKDRIASMRYLVTFCESNKFPIKKGVVYAK
jgi:hypothetical protein